VQPFKPLEGAALEAFLKRIRAGGPSAPSPALPDRVHAGNDPAVDRVIEALWAAKHARGNVMRTKGQDAAAGYLAPMPLPKGRDGAVESDRVEVHAPGATVTVKEAPAPAPTPGPRDFAKEKGELFARMLDFPDDLPGNVTQHAVINHEARLALWALEEQERKVAGDGPLSIPILPDLHQAPAKPAKEVEWERRRQSERAPEREEGGEPAPASLAPTVTPRHGGPAFGAEGTSVRRKLAVLGGSAALAVVLGWKLLSAPQGAGYAAPVAPAATSVEANPVQTHAPAKPDADAGEPVKQEVKAPPPAPPSPGGRTVNLGKPAESPIRKSAMPKAPPEKVQSSPPEPTPAKPPSPGGPDPDF
jgi:hypothetical protein